MKSRKHNLYSVLIVLSAILSAPLYGQGRNQMKELLQQVEENNMTLKALREGAKAEKLGNRTGIYLTNPDVEFNYVRGNKAATEGRQDVSVKQRFDFSVLSGLKGKVATVQNELVDLQYQTDRINILLEAKLYSLDLIYYSRMRKELLVRLEHAQSIATAQEERLKRGEGSILEYNNVQLNLSTAQGELERIETERTAILSQLRRLNGGFTPTTGDVDFDQVELPLSFEAWYVDAAEKNPLLSYVKQEVELGKKQISLSRSQSLPSISAGYTYEQAGKLRSQGLSLGVSIPLWENKNRIKQSKAALRAAEVRKESAYQQFFNQLEVLYERTAGLQKASEIYRRSLLSANNTVLLKKALDAGEISILDYIIEIGLYYNTVDQALSTERDYQKAFAELSATDL